MFSRPVSSGWKPVPTSSRLATRPWMVDAALGRLGDAARGSSAASILPAPLRPMMPTTSPRFTSKRHVLRAPRTPRSRRLRSSWRPRSVSRAEREALRRARDHVAQRGVALGLLALMRRSGISCRGPRRWMTTSLMRMQIRRIGEGLLRPAEVADAEPEECSDDHRG